MVRPPTARSPASGTRPASSLPPAPLRKQTSSSRTRGPLTAALALMGLLEERLRLPLVPVQEQTRARLRVVLERSGCCRAPRMSLRGARRAARRPKGERYGQPERALFAEFRPRSARRDPRPPSAGGTARGASTRGSSRGSFLDSAWASSPTCGAPDPQVLRTRTPTRCGPPRSPTACASSPGDRASATARTWPPVDLHAAMYVNVGAYVDEGTHDRQPRARRLVARRSAKRVHLSARGPDRGACSSHRSLAGDHRGRDAVGGGWRSVRGRSCASARVLRPGRSSRVDGPSTTWCRSGVPP